MLGKKLGKRVEVGHTRGDVDVGHGWVREPIGVRVEGISPHKLSERHVG